MESPTEYAERYEADEFCNLCITLINQTTYMLRKLLERQQQQFIENGGIKELMYRARVEYRSNQSYQNYQTGQTSRTDQSYPGKEDNK